ncbi:MAG: helix-turn-helix domain-containing protein [Candidatus Woesearchaeota archaeon]
MIVKEKNGIYSWRTEKFNVKLYYYALNNYVENGKIYVTSVGIIEGKNKELFFKSVSKDKKKHYFENNKNSFIFTYSEPLKSPRAEAIKLAYNPKFVYIKPTLVDEKGFEHWEIACPERKELEMVINLAHKWGAVDFKVSYLKKQKFSSLMIVSPMPNLTDKQKQALDLAVENGYYGYPRKIKLEKLAQMMRLSLSTYQFHLAKAEQKVLPNISKS